MRYLIVYIILFISTSTYEQLRKKLVLKNESEITGMLTEERDRVKIKTRSGNLWVFSKEEIDTIVNIKSQITEKGLFFHIEPLFLIGEESQFTAQIKVGYNITKNLGVGLGASFENHNNYGYFPLFTEFRWYVTNREMTPYLNFQAGYLLPVTSFNNLNGGFLIAPSIHLLAISSEHIGFSIGIGYRYQRLTSDYTDWWGHEIKYIYNMNRLELKMGIIIK